MGANLLHNTKNAHCFTNNRQFDCLIVVCFFSSQFGRGAFIRPMPVHINFVNCARIIERDYRIYSCFMRRSLHFIFFFLSFFLSSFDLVTTLHSPRYFQSRTTPKYGRKKKYKTSITKQIQFSHEIIVSKLFLHFVNAAFNSINTKHFIHSLGLFFLVCVVVARSFSSI